VPIEDVAGAAPEHLEQLTNVGRPRPAGWQWRSQRRLRLGGEEIEAEIGGVDRVGLVHDQIVPAVDPAPDPR
jgi:hypothetical protein